MEMSLILAEQIMTMVCMAIAGIILCRTKIITEEKSQVLSQLLIYLLSPCVLLSAFRGEATPDKLEGLMAVSIGALITLVAFILLAEVLKRGKRGLSAGERVCAVFSNAGMVVIPIIQGMLGTEYVIYTAPLLFIQSVLLWTYGANLLSGNSRKSIKSLLLQPNIVAIFLGLAMFLTGISFPAPIQSAVNSLGNCVGPVGMIVIGALLTKTDFGEVAGNRQIYRTVFLRLIGFPFVAILVAWGIGRFWQGTNYQNILLVLLLGSIGPSASIITSLAQVNHHPDEKLVSSVNALSVILCCITMPLQCFLLQVLLA